MTLKVLPAKCILILVLLIFQTASLAQIPESVVPAADNTPVPVDKQESPRDFAQRLMQRLSLSDNSDISDMFDKRFNRSYKQYKLTLVANNFASLLDEFGTLRPTNLLSNSPQGSIETGLAAQNELIGEFKLNSGDVPILLIRIRQDDGRFKWFIARETVLAIYENMPEQHQTVIEQVLPELLVTQSWRGAPIGQWLSVPIFAIVAFALSWLLTFGSLFIIKRYTKITENTVSHYIIDVMLRPACIVIAVVIFLFMSRFAGLSILIRQSFSVFTISLIWIAFFIFVWSLVNRVAEHSEKYLREKNKVGGLSILIFLRASAKVVLFTLAAIILLDTSGYDVSTWLAALGIGGIALALGAQKTIENLVGSIMLVVDQPFRVGDFCKIGDCKGTVEHIGMRSTSLRTLSDTVVTIPNGALSGESIENFTRRQRFLVKTTLNLRYETPIDKLEELLVALRKNLTSFEFVIPMPARVRFIGYGAFSLDVEVMTYIRALNYEIFLEKQEKLLLSFSHIVEEHGSGFAFPSQTIYTAEDNFPTETSQQVLSNQKLSQQSPSAN